MHKSFEELCALAATGQITGDAMSVLDQHVKECDMCRAFLQDMVSLKAHVAPVVAGSHVRTLEAPAGIRERFLERASAAGLKLNPGPALPVAECLSPPPPVGRLTFAETLRLRLVEIEDRCQSVPRYAVVTAALLCGVVGYLLAQHQVKRDLVTLAVMRPSVVAPAPAAPTPVASDHSAEIATLKQINADEREKLET